MTRLIIGVSVIGLLSVACSDRGDPEALLADYLGRVSRVLEVDVDPRAFTVELAPFPARRDLQLALPDLRIGMFDFLALRRCALHGVVAERNSALGRVMPDSQRLVYERRFLTAARACLQQLDPEADTDMIDQLRHAMHAKSASLPQAIWNAGLAGPEFTHHLSLSAAALPIDDNPGPDVAARLDAVARALATNAQDSVALEQALQQIQTDRSGGALLRSAALLIRYLDATAAVLELRQQRRALCPQDRPTPRARTLHTVFMKFYVGQVQPYLSHVHRRSRSWLAAIQNLRTLQPQDEPPAFMSYAEQSLSPSAGLWRRFDAAIERHTRAWQTVLQQCDLMPTGPTTARAP